MMKNILIGIIVVAIIGSFVWWLRGAKDTPNPDTDGVVPDVPQSSTTPVLPTTPRETVQSSTLSKPIRTLTTKNNMKIDIMKEGTGPQIKTGQTATVDYEGKLADGSVFDASKKHGTGGFSFSLGAGNVIKGWDEGVVGMKVGETRILTIPPELAYGPNGYPPVIPPNATLTFEVTLLAIK